ncbi:MAG: translation initiation factor 2 [Firmicutes bacterium]|nr:translation initiation factor 2 [Bacillota bacterium]
MRCTGPTVDDLAREIQHLEDRVRALRLGRRVLMNIIYAQVADRQVSMARLRSENRRLKDANVRYARAILESHNRVRRLEEQLERNSPQSGGSGALACSGQASSS